MKVLREFESHSFRHLCGYGEMVDTEDLKSSAYGVLVRLRLPAPNVCDYSITDNAVGFYPTNVGSIPACRTRYVSGASWTGTGLQTHGSRFDSCHLFQIMRVW